MKITAYRTTMPFLDNQLSPLTDKSRPFNGIDRDTDRRKNLGLNQDHVAIPNADSEPKSYVNVNLFHGEIEWNRSGLSGEKEPVFVAYLFEGPPVLFRNKSVDSIVKELKSKNLKWRLISPLVAESGTQMRKISQEVRNFVPFVSKILAGCFKIESECYSQNLKEIGSAFYIKNDFLFTCAHVISKKKDQDLRDVALFVIDGEKKYWASVVDIDYDLDVALLYCDSPKHSVLGVKTIDSVQVGQEVICVGSPYGYDNNVTKGIVSSKDRKIKSGDAPYFFMDLSVYPGSSGGPIVDSSDGKVIGMAAIIVESVGNYGLNAGLPIDICMKRFGKYVTTGEPG